MQLLLPRLRKGKSVIGGLYVNGEWFCHTLEPPPDRAEHPCIPAGQYEVVVEQSPKFGRILPELQRVPGRTEILIHRGNTANDTEGCIIVGDGVSGWQIAGGTSKMAEERLVILLKAAKERGEEIRIDIKDAYEA